MVEKPVADWAILETLQRTGSVRFVARGGSMRPWLRSGTELSITACQPSELVPGDLVLAEMARGLVVHRAMRSVANGWMLRGDACRDEEYVASECIHGRVDGFIVGRVHAGPIFSRSVERRVRQVLRHLLPLVQRGARIFTGAG